MSQGDDERPPDRIAGLSLDAAAEAVVDRGDASDTESARAALSHVAEEGTVTTDAADDALAELSKVVSTPETRAEFAEIELSEARELADPVADLDTVQGRLDAFEDRLDAVEDRVAELGRELRAVVDEPHADLYETAVGVQRLTSSADAAQRAADEIYVEAEEFQRWLTDADTRAEAFAEEVDALADSLDRLADAAADLDARTGAADGESAGDGDDMDVEGDADPAVGWIDATFRHRAVGLLFADLRAELADLRTMAERQASADAVADVDDLDGRLAALEDRWAALGDRLDDLARPSWHDRFDDRLTALEGALDGFEPPVDWGRVQAALDEHRAGIDGLESERQ